MKYRQMFLKKAWKIIEKEIDDIETILKNIITTLNAFPTISKITTSFMKEKAYT